ncbi:MAG: DUF1571 domain-containing protein [Planctomycetota bacterium]|nr:MAG: DUF1571 domain-containing protein [Planctomycetota bacterium]REJ88100.1 MAG: DUF1571 domain-containing protein [Planctomycetota bacterium]REK21715.1 MAG: DUF1571 domain-containing protein [Planctomycetota bacterium]REK43121.1 MAG: DUF1571 domain-containing protein [Planctomycetota bacterium]
MSRWIKQLGVQFALVAFAAFVGASLWAEEGETEPATAREADGDADGAVAPAAATEPAQAHPLDPEIASAKRRLEALKTRVQEYSCRMIKRERIGGELRPREIIDMKVRHEPFSVFLEFLSPENVKGQQVAYIEGRNDGKMVVRPVGVKGIFGPVKIRPDGPLAMQDQRYPITHIGFVRLTEELIAVAEHDRQFGECEVRTFKGAKIGDRVCTVTEVVHPVARNEFRFHRARIFVDDELDIPIRFASWSWPTEEGGKPVLEEEYTYTNLKLNPGFTDADFTIE